MGSQGGFLFVQSLAAEHEPVSQIPTRKLCQPRPEWEESALLMRVSSVTATMPENFALEDVLALLGTPEGGWLSEHRRIVWGALLSPLGPYSCYDARTAEERENTKGMRLLFRHRVPLEPCPECGRATIGGILCIKCRQDENHAIDAADEDRLNRD